MGGKSLYFLVNRLVFILIYIDVIALARGLYWGNIGQVIILRVRGVTHGRDKVRKLVKKKQVSTDTVKF